MATLATSYPSTKERANYARICRAIVDLCTDVLREVLSSRVVPSHLLNKLKACDLIRSFVPGEMVKINQSVKKSSYKNFDISLLYKVITTLSVQELRDDLYKSIPAKEVWTEVQKRHLLYSKLSNKQVKQIKQASTVDNYSSCDCELLVLVISNISPGYKPSVIPSKKVWGGNMPSPGEHELGDDIERIRILRNKVYGHVSDTQVTDKECNKIFEDLKEIMLRMDQRLMTSGQFAKSITDIETCPIDENWDKYISELEVLNEADKVVRKELDKTKENLEEISQKVTSIDEKTSKTENRIQALSETESAMSDNMNCQNERLTKVESKLCEVEGQVKLSQEKEADLKKEVEKQIENVNKLQRIRVTDEDNAVSVPVHIKEQNKLAVDQWKMEDQVYVETKATKQVYDRMQENNILTVTGNGGTGKSATIRHLALQLQLQDYEIFEIHSPVEMKANLNPNTKQLFVIDDPVGIHVLDKNMFNVWLMYDDSLNRCLSRGNVKFLCSIRKQIVNDPEFMSEKCILNKCIMDMQSMQSSLDPREKMAMFKQHMSVNMCKIEITEKAEDILIKADEQFPLLCKLFFSDQQFQTNDFMFFKKPFSLFFKELDKLKSSDKRKYCILVLCFVNGNCFVPHEFNPFEQPDTNIDSIIGACGVNRYKFIEALNDNLHALTGVFLTKEGHVYRFCHDVIHDVVAFHFGQKFPKQMIKFSPSRFLCERVVVNSEMAQGDPYVIVLPCCLFDNLIERLLEDLEKNIHYYVFMNKCWKDDLFMQTFEQKFNHDKEHILDLFTRESHTTSEYHDIIIKHLQFSDAKDTWTWHYKAMDLLRFSGITALHWVVTFAKKRLFDNIWMYLSSDQRNHISRNFPVLHLACLGGDVHICKAILLDKDERKKINAPFSNNLTSSIGELFICDYLPLHLGAMNNVEVVKLLLERGAEINMTQGMGSLAGRSALFHASGRGKTDIVSLLIGKGADVNICALRGLSPLLTAVFNNHADVVRLLLENHANIDKEFGNGVTPLMMACYFGYIEIIKILLQFQPDVDKKDKCGFTALTIANYIKNKEILQILQRYKRSGVE